MSVWVLTQILFNLMFGIFLFILWVKIQKEPQEDPRLSKGLQVLQTKISILEDLSDRTDRQVKDLCTIIERKSKEIEQTIIRSEEQLVKIESAIKENFAAAEVFQDEVPHDTIVERKSSQKYIDAALLAHQGLSKEEIAEKIDLSEAEIEFITKVNKDRLMFSKDHLPSWAKRDVSEVFSQSHYDQLKDLGEKFRSAKMTKEEKEEQEKARAISKAETLKAALDNLS